ncbi:hypothetical protein GCM10017744_104340 [Streptomyces antimycoticus]|uniref:Uncharacterized protein n=1 Tax=Streptomyces antimycoticus TaxID=68175 RepID=A0A4D4KRT1_9ACTN|nr:hypothetical protein [Streptomyces antimycoticus]GDY49157.1 hypothetical protein SANT12839_100390 [Streptomyces antimycoticus]
MSRKQVLAVAVLVAVFAWSTVMTVLGQLAAVVTLLPSLGLLVQQIVTALGGMETRRDAAADPSPAATAGTAGHGELPR